MSVRFDRSGIEMPATRKKSKTAPPKSPLPRQRKRALHDLAEIRHMGLSDLHSAYESAMRQHAAAIGKDPHRALSLAGWINGLHDEIQRRQRDAQTVRPAPIPASRERPLSERVAAARRALGLPER